MDKTIIPKELLPKAALLTTNQVQAALVPICSLYIAGEITTNEFAYQIVFLSTILTTMNSYTVKSIDPNDEDVIQFGKCLIAISVAVCDCMGKEVTVQDIERGVDLFHTRFEKARNTVEMGKIVATAGRLYEHLKEQIDEANK